MSEEINDYENEEALNNQGDSPQEETITKVTGMYKEWFLDYASYVILERRSEERRVGKECRCRWETYIE